MRGKLKLLHLLKRFRRITPACAGKTIQAHITFIDYKDHPRVCGENGKAEENQSPQIGSPPRVRGKRNYLLSCKSHLGSPPRVRGKQGNPDKAVFLARITPACAGKTLWKWRISVVDPSPQPQSSLTSRRADASSGSQRAPCAAPV